MCTFGVLGLSCEAPGKKKSEILDGPAEGRSGGGCPGGGGPEVGPEKGGAPVG